MINPGIIQKAMKDWLPVTIGCSAFLFLMELALSFVLPTMQEEFADNILTIEFVRKMIESMLGAKIAGQVGIEMFSAFPWVHPVIVIIVCAHAILCCSKTPAGEVDRGTIDIYACLPLSRASLFINETVACIGCLCILLVTMLFGNQLGGVLASVKFSTPLRQCVPIVANLATMYLAIAGISWFASSLSSRRDRAMLAVFGILLASILFNFLVPFWKPAEHLAFLGLLNYYRPFIILRDAAWPTADIAVLGTIATATWLAALIIFSRRDLAAS